MPGIGKRNVISETVVSLQADIDNTGINKLLSLLDENKMRAYALTGALAAVTTGIYKFIEGVTKEEFELENLAKKKEKSIKQTRAEEAALKAMGKTLKDIEKDKALKSMYDDVVKFNKSLEMPNMRNALANVNKLRTEFYKLKSAVSYAIQTIGAQVLTNLEMPMDRVGGKVRSFAEWIRDNLNSIGMKIGSYITAFAKGIIGIGETIGKVFNWINEMPDGIKNIAMALGSVFLLIKTGPLGQILAVVSAIGDVIHAYEVWQWNQQNKENPTHWFTKDGGYTDNPNDENILTDEAGKAVAYQVETYGDEIWEIIDDKTKDTKEKASGVVQKIVGNINDVLVDAINGLNTGGDDGIRGWVKKLTGPLGEIIEGIISYIESDDGKAKLGSLVSNLFTTIASILKEAGDIGVDITASMAEMIGSIFGGADWEKAFKDSDVAQFLKGDNGFATGLSTALETAFVGGDFLTSILTGAISTYQKEREKTLRELYEEDKGKSGIDWGDIIFGDDGLPTYVSLEEHYRNDDRVAQGIADSLADDFNETINAALELLAGAVKITSDASSKVLKSIVLGIFGTEGTVKDALGAVSDDNPIFKSFSMGLATWIASGDFLLGLVGAITALVGNTESEDQLKEAADEIAEMFWTIWDGAWEDDTHTKRNGKGLHTFLKQLWEGEDGNGGVKKFFEGVADKVVDWLKPVGEKITEWFNSLWISIYNKMPDWLKGAFENPNMSGVEERDGKYYLVTTEGREKEISEAEAAGIKQIDNYEKKVSIDENGNIIGPGWESMLREAGEGNILTSFAAWFLNTTGLTKAVTGERDYEDVLEEVSAQRPEALRDWARSLDKDSDYGKALQWYLYLKSIEGEHEGDQDFADTMGYAIDRLYPSASEVYTGDKFYELIENPDFVKWLLDNEWSNENPYPLDYPGSTSGSAVPKGMDGALIVGGGTQEYMAYGNGVRPGGKNDNSGTNVVIGAFDDVGETANDVSDKLGSVADKSSEAAKDVDDLGTEAKNAWPHISKLGELSGGSEIGVQQLGDAASTAAGELLKIKAPSVGSFFGGLFGAQGGRYDTDTRITIGEDGAEYLIPITKPERAFSLIHQMLSEMGSSAIKRVTQGFGFGSEGAIGHSPNSMSSALQGMTMANTYNITAPVSINVNASGANGVEIGTTIYDAAERHLIKTLKGVV